MPASFHILLCIFTIIASLLNAQARPMNVLSHVSREPASLLGHSYPRIEEKREPLILMNPALNKGLETPSVPTGPSTSSSHKTTTNKKVKAREQPMPFARYLSERATSGAHSNRRRGETHPVSYLSNENPIPPPPSAPSPAAVPEPSMLIPDTDARYIPYGMEEPKPKQSKKKGSGKKGGDGQGKLRSKEDKKKGKGKA